MITTTPISPSNILKGSSPTSNSGGTGGKKTSRPPKGSKQFSSPLSNNSSFSNNSIPPMTPNDQLPQQNLQSYKGPVIPPTHFPYFPMNPMAIHPNPMMFGPMNHPMHMMPTTPPMFAMFPQPVVMPNIPPPTPVNNNIPKIPPPIQPKPSTSPPSNNPTLSHATKPKQKKKKKTPNNVASNNSTTASSSGSNPKPSAKRKTAPSASLSVHEHIISYLWELGLKDSAKILENDLNNPLLLNAPQNSISCFVHNLSNEIERHSPVVPPNNKKISNEITNTSIIVDTKQPIQQQQNCDALMNDIQNNSQNINVTTDTKKYDPETFLNVLKQTTKPEVQRPTVEYVNERLENLEQTLGIKEQKVEVFSRIKDVEARMLKLDVNHEPHEDDFFKDFFDTENTDPMFMFDN